MTKRIIFGAAVLAMLAGAAVWGQETAPDGRGEGRGGAGRGPTATAPAATQNKPLEARSDTSTTTGVLKSVSGSETPYTAIAGYMPLKDETGKLRANMFYVSYTAGTAPAATAAATDHGEGSVTTTRPESSAAIGANPGRPIIFCFNGGPGAASAWLHLGAVGPKRLDVPADGTAPAAPYRVIDNEYSWLSASDLVFIDPVNTGYSRAATPEQAREFFNVTEDINSMGEFIRLYLTQYQRWASPVYLAGESYGTTRAAGLSNYLQERVGVSVSGIVLISTVLNFENISPGEENDLPYMLYLPSYTAVAWYHKKVPDPKGGGGLEALLKESEVFAQGDYNTALAKGATLAQPDREKIARRVADLTGLSADFVLSNNLRIDPSRFEKQLLRAPDGSGQVIGRFDGRIAGWPTDPGGDGQEYDPSLSGFYPAYTSAFNEYVRHTLKYENNLSYEVLSNRTQPWNFGSGPNSGGTGFLYVGDDLRNAMTHNPRLRVLVCSGRFDLATPYFATDYTLSHMRMAPEIRKNITQTYYPGGHMLYHVHEGLAKLYTDVTGFLGAGAQSGDAKHE